MLVRGFHLVVRFTISHLPRKSCQMMDRYDEKLSMQNCAFYVFHPGPISFDYLTIFEREIDKGKLLAFVNY